MPKPTLHWILQSSFTTDQNTKSPLEFAPIAAHHHCIVTDIDLHLHLLKMVPVANHLSPFTLPF